MNIWLILGAALVLIIVVVVIVFLLTRCKNSDTSCGSHSITDQAQIMRGLANPKDFSLLFPNIPGSIPCNLSQDKPGNPAYVIILRHCDRRFKTELGCKMPGACQGSGAEGATGSCETNDCSATGLTRAWSVAKWINCFATTVAKPVVAIVGQVFQSGVTNMRPTTTASIILESLNYHGLNPCYVMVKKSDTPNMKNFIYKSSFADKIVVVVTDHGEINNMEKALVGKTSGKWADDCFDAASVINVSANTVQRYSLHTLSDNDPCADCGNGVGQYSQCSYHKFGDTNPGKNW